MMCCCVVEVIKKVVDDVEVNTYTWQETLESFHAICNDNIHTIDLLYVMTLCLNILS